MRIVDLAHRWAGALIGLLLTALGLSGALLVYRDAWLRLTVPGASDVALRDDAGLAEVALFAFSDPATRPKSLVYATDTLGVDRVSYGRDAGAYLNQAGDVVAQWQSSSDRIELWLFDLHHHLLMGKAGATFAGILALVGIAFVVTGIILWWRTRRTFVFRLWPKWMSQSAIVRQHRDFGVVIAPLLFLSLLTGAMMTLKPVSGLLLSPFSSPAVMAKAREVPKVQGGPIGSVDWRNLIGEVRRAYPQGEIRSISLPEKQGDLIAVRVRQPTEWLPNGRTMLWFDPANGHLVDQRNALTQPLGQRVFNLVYPVHAAKVGGPIYTVLTTLSGLGLALLGSLAVFSFWRGKASRRRSPAVRRAAYPS